MRARKRLAALSCSGFHAVEAILIAVNATPFSRESVKKSHSCCCGYIRLEHISWRVTARSQSECEPNGSRRALTFRDTDCTSTGLRCLNMASFVGTNALPISCGADGDRQLIALLDPRH